MSVISQTHHKVVAFDKGSKAFMGNVLLRIIDKSREGKASGLNGSKCVSVPMIQDAEIAASVSKLMPAIQDMIHDARQQIARGLILEGATEIATESINVDACAAWLTSESSGRITTQLMQEWFMENYAEIAMEFVCKQVKFHPEALTQDQEKAVMQKTNVIRDVFAGFASGKYKPALPVCKMIVGFGAFCSDQIDSRMKAILEKTEKIRDEQIRMLDMDFEQLLDMIPAPVEKKAVMQQQDMPVATM